MNTGQQGQWYSWRISHAKEICRKTSQIDHIQGVNYTKYTNVLITTHI